MSSVMVIGIAGGTGSGKTTITRKLTQKFSGNISVISLTEIRSALGQRMPWFGQ